MSDRFEVKIISSADTKGFKDTAAAAQQMGTSVEQSATRSQRALTALRDNAGAIGATMGTAVTTASFLGRAYVEQEQQIRGLNYAYGDASRELQDFARNLQDITVYSDDAGRAALLGAATITREYGIATDQVDDLVLRAADLSAIFGGDLKGNTDRLTSAIRGEAEAAEALGIAMSDTALQAYAASQGMTGWNTTMTEAEKAQVRFMVLMEQTAYAQGAAAEAADTNAGKARQLMNDIQDLTQVVGGALGPIGEYSSVLGDLALIAPLAGAGIGKLAAAIGLIGGAGVLAPLATVAGIGALAYGYNDREFGSTAINTGANQFFLYGSKGMNALLPGNPYDEQKYIDQMELNGQADAIASLLIAPGEDISVAWDRIAMLTGRITGEMSKDELVRWVVDQARYTGMSVPYYIESKARGNEGFMRDPVTGVYMPSQEYYRYSNARYFDQGGNLTSGAFTMGYGNLADSAFVDRQTRYPYLSSYRAGGGSGAAALPEGAAAYMSGGMGAVAMSGIGQQPVFDQATQGIVNANMLAAGFAVSGVVDLEAYRAKLTELFGAYAGVVEGVNSANDAHMAFKATQDGILQSQGPYNQQLQEYNGVLSDMEAGYEVLQQRQAEGIALTAEEQAFLEKYPALYDRVKGGVDDATVANALLAGQYAENMSKGDELNRTLAGNTAETGNLVEAIELLILSLNGVPEEVQTRILVNNIEYAISSVDTFAALLNGLPDSKTVAVYYQTYGDYVPGSVQSPFMHGGVVGYANGGVVARMAEAGPELLRFANGGTAWAMQDGLYNVPRGTYVTPAPASRGQGRQAPGIVINGNVTVIANDARQMYDSLNEYARGGSRL